MEQVNQLVTSVLGQSADGQHSVIKTFLLITLFIILVRIIKDALKYLMTLYKMIDGVFRPINYELDMTTREFCKRLAEVDNSLRIQTKRERVTQTNRKEQSGVNFSGDCKTAALAEALNEASDKSFELSANARGPSDTVADRANDEVDEYVYPNGWLPLMESSKVKVGEIKRALFQGRDLIVTRSSEGKVDVLSAYCPHMGVNIGVGGQVCRHNNESCVQCPFHGWTFRASDGQCVNIPYVKETVSRCGIPKQARLEAHQSCEVNNFIYLWHHIDNQPPSWQLEQTAELASGHYWSAGRSCHTANVDIRDMAENGADVHHFEGIHVDLFLLGSDCLKARAFSFVQKYIRHHWSAKWNPMLDAEGRMSHMAEMRLSSSISVFKCHLFTIEVRATQIGPASVKLHYDSPYYGKGILIMNAVPLGGRRTLIVQHIYAQPTLFSWIMAKIVLRGEIMQLERDLYIWNHKKSIPAPVFVPEDKLVKRFRLWYSQFYKRKCKITIGEKTKPAKSGSVDGDNKLNLDF